MPRHFTASPCCVGCRLRQEACVCARAPRLDLATRVILVVHLREWGRSANTGHLLRLALRNAEVRVHGLPNQAVSSRGIDLDSPSTLVLFPGRGAQVLTRDYLATLPRPLTLLVPDGTWNQARNMMRRVPMLGQAHPVRLEGPSLDLTGLRHNDDTDRRSTFESIAQTLGLLEGDESERRLLDFFRGVLDRKYGC